MAERSVIIDVKVEGDGSLKNTQKEIDKIGISSAKAADNALKFTKGIAGGFQLASQAAGAFGEDSEAAFQKTIAKATQYVALSTALKDTAEGFANENVAGLKEIAKNFTKTGIGAKLFGTTTRAAIAATGIGLLIIAIATLAANWDTVTAAVGKFADSIPFLKTIKDIVEETIERFGTFSNLLSGVGAYIVALFTDGANAAEEFNRAVEEGKAVDVLNEHVKALELVNKEIERSIEILTAQGNKEEEIFDIKKRNINENIRLLEKINDKSQDQIDLLEDYRQKLKLVEIQEVKFRNTQAKLADAAAKKSKEEQDKLVEEQRKIDDDKKKEELEKQKKEEAQEIRIRDLKVKLLEDDKDKEQQIINNAFDDKIKGLDKDEKLYNQEVIELNNNRNKELAESDKKFRAIARKIELADLQDKYDEILSITEILANDITNELVGIGGTLEEGFFAKVFTEESVNDAREELKRLRNELALIGDEEGVEKLNLDLALINVKLTDLGFRAVIKESKVFFEFVAEGVEKTKESFEQFREGFEETGQLISDFAAVAADATNQIFASFADAQQRQLDGLQLQFELVDSRYQESVNNRRALEDELATADGARRIEILNSLKEEGKQEKKLAAEKEKIKKSQIDAQNKINELAYTNAIIQATISAAQAVLAALTTVPPASFVLAAITAALAIIQVGIVIANKPKKISYAEGGYTPQSNAPRDETGERPVGLATFHEGEYISPRRQVNRYPELFTFLDNDRKKPKSFADGGFTTPNLGSTDPNQLGAQSLIAALEGLKLQVAVTEITDVQARVSVIESRATI